MLRQPAILAHSLGSVHIECHNFFRRKPHRQRTLRTVNARVDLAVELELDAELFLCKLLHGKDFMLVDAGRYRLQLKRQPPRPQQLHSAQAPFVRARYLRQFFIRFFAAAVQRNLDGKRRPFQQVVRNPFGDERAVGKQSNQKTLFLGVGVNLQKVLAGENLPSRIQKPEAPHLDQLIEQAKMLFRAHFATAGVLICHGQVVVAVPAFQRTAPRHFNRNL